jgi:MSHA biogenesis protein MshJ
MKALAAQIHQLSQWIDRQSLRERVALLAAILVVVVFCCDALYYGPQRRKRAEINAQITALNAALVSLDSQAEAIKARGQKDPDQEHRVRQRQLQAELDRLDQRLEAVTIGLFSPRDMAGVLRDLLIRQKGLRLTHLENLPAEDLFEGAEKNQEGNDDRPICLYRHPMRIVFSGTYLQTLAYLRSLESLPRKLYWDALEVVVSDHPQGEISLRVHTLSLKKGWIGA